MHDNIKLISRRYFGEGYGDIAKAHARISQLVAPYDDISYSLVFAYWSGRRRPDVWPLKHIVDTAPAGDPLVAWAKECLQVIRPQVWGEWQGMSGQPAA